MINVEVIAPDAGGQKISLLPVRGLPPSKRVHNRSVSSWAAPMPVATNGGLEDAGFRHCSVDVVDA